MKKRVKSSNLEFVEYIADRKELRIWFLNEKNVIYAYANVTQKIYDELIKACSIGGFFTSYIKYKYAFKKIGVDFAEGKDKSIIAGKEIKKTLSDMFITGNDVFDDEFYYTHDSVKEKIAEFIDYVLIGKAFPDIKTRTESIREKSKEIFGEKLCQKPQ